MTIHARLGGLELRGFRRFQHPRKFSFAGPDGRPPETLILAGPNGSGKSSFFEAVLYALGREDLLHRQLGREHVERWLEAALATDVEVRLMLEVSSAHGTLLGPRAPCSVEVIRTRSDWRLLEGRDGKPVAEAEGVVRSLLDEIGLTWFSSWRQPYLCGAIRPMGPRPEGAPGEAGRLWQVKQRFIDERARSAFRGTVGPESEWLAKLSAAWSALRGDDGTRLGIGADRSDRSASEFDLFVERSDPDFGGVRICPVDQLSSGELEWLTLAGSLITEDFIGIVLIDEPELHLHPEWQARLLPALRAVAQESQLIMASHADPPWDQVYSFERVPLDLPERAGGAVR